MTDARYIYPATGICPKEIHFTITDGRLRSLRFAGGGCPGNAELVTRLVEGMPVENVQEFLPGIVCQNGTSCPDQLQKALASALSGSLAPAEAFRIKEAKAPFQRVAVVGDINGNAALLADIFNHASRSGADAVAVVGNLTGGNSGDPELVKTLEKAKALALCGEADATRRNGNGAPENKSGRKVRDFLVRTPEVLSFNLEALPAVAFYGDYLQDLPGYSDFLPFSLEINMVCGLARRMQDESVFGALAAMLPGFSAKVVLFGQSEGFGAWNIEDTLIATPGPVVQGKDAVYGLLTVSENGANFEKMTFTPS